MEFKIYDYEGRPKQIITDYELQNIVSLKVRVFSGDETIEILTEDGVLHEYDSSDCRWLEFYDALYFLTHPADIADWFAYGEREDVTAYNRAEKFG